ncbi:MAG: Cob(I)alamin adenosyltransferase [Candidatus Levybacteria bacterium]|nr:Cob(I)alamin adenosyltransferase [Candidatus Levybacteria bacterium]
MAIYTRTGDKGTTSLFSSKRVSKSDLRIEVLGAIDELNSLIGVVICEIRNPKSETRNKLEKIQNDLLSIGSSLADPIMNYKPLTMNYLPNRVKEFENFIDQMTENLPPLRNFILPGGGKTGAMLHLARAVCRRAERRIVGLNHKGKLDNSIIIYFNRLSDLLFTLARFVNFKEKKKEVVWINK